MSEFEKGSKARNLFLTAMLITTIAPRVESLIKPQSANAAAIDPIEKGLNEKPQDSSIIDTQADSEIERQEHQPKPLSTILVMDIQTGGIEGTANEPEGSPSLGDLIDESINQNRDILEPYGEQNIALIRIGLLSFLQGHGRDVINSMDTVGRDSGYDATPFFIPLENHLGTVRVEQINQDQIVVAFQPDAEQIVQSVIEIKQQNPEIRFVNFSFQFGDVGVALTRTQYSGDIRPEYQNPENGSYSSYTDIDGNTFYIFVPDGFRLVDQTEYNTDGERIASSPALQSREIEELPEEDIIRIPFEEYNEESAALAKGDKEGDFTRWFDGNYYLVPRGYSIMAGPERVIIGLMQEPEPITDSTQLIPEEVYFEREESYERELFGAYSGEHGVTNLRQAYQVAQELDNQDLIIGTAAGNLADDLIALREQIGEEQPANLLFYGVWDEGKPKFDVWGADIYFPNEDYGLDEASSFATPADTMALAILADLSPDLDNQQLIDLFKEGACIRQSYIAGEHGEQTAYVFDRLRFEKLIDQQRSLNQTGQSAIRTSTGAATDLSKLEIHADNNTSVAVFRRTSSEPARERKPTKPVRTPPPRPPRQMRR